MKKKLQKDIKIKKHFNQQELNYLILKSLVKNENLPFTTKCNAILKLSIFFKSQNKTQFINRCLLSNGKAKYNRVFKKFSRLSFLLLARSGKISGLKKSSW